MFKNIKKSDAIFWIVGIVINNLGIAFCTKASFGLNMIAAPPYIIHVWLRDRLPWFTQGTSEYVWEGLILIITCIIIKTFKPKYLLSFVTAIICGFMMDFWLKLLGGNGAYHGILIRIIAFVVGLCCNGIGVACYFRTNMPLQVYELSVKEFCDVYKQKTTKIKHIFDIGMFTISIIFAYILTHSFAGLGVGTIVATIVNAPLIGFFGKVIDAVILKNIKK